MDEDRAHYAALSAQSATTNVDLLVVILVGLAIILMLTVPRKYIVIPFLLAVLIIPMGQVVAVAGLNFQMFRIIILFGWCRILFARNQNDSREAFRFNPIDKAMLYWAIASVVTFTLLYLELPALVNRMGLMFNALGTYFLLRLILRDQEDIDRSTKIFAFICALVAVFMLNELFTGRNLFSVLGGVPQFSMVREGSIRAQGPFAHSILAGTFGAIMMPLFVGLLWRNKGRVVPLLGLFSSAIIILASHSSTPLGAMAAVIAGFCLWHFRNWMRQLRWGLVFTLLGLHMVMKAPVWALIGRLDMVGGSSGYHRFILVDNFIRHFNEWWLLGVKDTEHWGYDMWDISNQFVGEGVRGGLLTFVLFLAIIVYCFKGLGAARKQAEANGDVMAARAMWTLGTALLANIVAFFGITYFDQTAIAWYAFLAMIATVSFVPNPALAAETEGDRTLEADVAGILDTPAIAKTHPAFRDAKQI